MDLERLDDFRLLIPKSGRMVVPGMIYATSQMEKDIVKEEVVKQVVNVATLPGILKYSIAMPDVHWGYGFPIGGVAAFNMDDGVISPGGVGYDINCGVRLIKSSLLYKDVLAHVEDLLNILMKTIPTGLGSKRKDLRLCESDYAKVLTEGAKWAVKNGFGTNDDILNIEEYGAISGAIPDVVSKRAYERGRDQLGTLGSGNHFIEIGRVTEIYNKDKAEKLGLFADQVTIMVHTGSRGFGYQICDDYIRIMIRAAEKYGIHLPDRQLCAAPINSNEGKEYFGAMAAASNYAFCNRQIITHWIRETFSRFFKKSYEHLGMSLLYDVAHNIAKFENHEVDGNQMRVCVHRKGATRALPAHHPDLPLHYKELGQPVLIPGDMGSCSYVLLGTEKSLTESFASTCHGAGRVMSRNKAIEKARGRNITKELKDRGIVVVAENFKTILEEIPEAYKDVTEVVDVVSNIGIAEKVAKLEPLGVIKG